MKKELVKDLGFEFLRNKTKREIENIVYLGDGVYFLGEVNGTNFITYDELLEWIWPEGEDFANDSYISLRKDKKTKGNWLYFADSKYKNRGRTRFFYIAKKPILKLIPWNILDNNCCVYGVDSKGAHVSTTIINDKEYIIRLPYGVGNFSLDNKVNDVNFLEDAKRKSENSEWNRTIVALVNSRKLNYSWLKHLNSNIMKDPTDMAHDGGDGQWTLCQEFIDDTNMVCVRGSGLADSKDGVAHFMAVERWAKEFFLGYRPVLEYFIYP